MATGGSPEALECLQRLGRRWGLRYIVLYGSRARGYAAPWSDYDLAVKAGRRLSFRERGLLQVELEECLHSRVDLSFIDDWNPILAWEALARGRLLYSCGASCEGEYYDDLARALDEVADLEPLIELVRREARRALSRADV
ncbi:MAG: nucleotidyltransferase domain-containing protein [Desulfurococcales archaeon]|nr:nucleotidyltransferase domain-containing protein [Desulfurococcales archaeon]